MIKLPPFLIASTLTLLAPTTLPAADTPDLGKNGAFGFPQATAKVLANHKELRLSAWSNAEWLYVQAVIWADGDDASANMPDGRKIYETSRLHLDLDANKEPTVRLDRIYTVYEHLHLDYALVAGRAANYGSEGDSKGRGSVRYVTTTDGKKVRVDSFLIPLSELGRKPGDKIRLILGGKSAVPKFDFNSARIRFGGADGPMLFSSAFPDQSFHDFTVGEQSGTIDPTQVPDGAK